MSLEPYQKIITSTFYKCTDGVSFAIEEDAIAHQTKLDFEEWYEDNELLGSYEGSKVDMETLIDYLRENKTRMINLIKLLED